MVRLIRAAFASAPAVATLLMAGCHCFDRCPALPSPVVGPVAVVGAVELPGTVGVSARGGTLREVVAAAGGPKAASARGDAGSTYVRLSRPEADYYFAAPLVAAGPAGAVAVRPGDRVEVVTWSDTDLARGLAAVEVADLTLHPATYDLRSVYGWVVKLYGSRDRLGTAKSAQLDDPARFAELVSDIAVGYKVSGLLDGANGLDGISLSVGVAQQVAAQATRAAQAAWLETVFVPAVLAEPVAKQTLKLGGRAGTTVERYSINWAAVWPAYKDAAWVPSAVAPGSAAPGAVGGTAGVAAMTPKAAPVIGVAFSGPGEVLPLDRSLLTVTPPVGETPAGHPSLKAFFTLLTEYPSPGVVHIVRQVGGRRTEFALEYLVRDKNSAGWDISRVQDYQRLQSTLAFDGDVIEVTNLGRLPIVLAGILAPLVEQRVGVPARTGPLVRRFPRLGR